MTSSAPVTHVTVAGVSSKRNLGGLFEDKEGGEQTPRILPKSDFLGETSTGKGVREIQRSAREGVQYESRTMARVRATDGNITDSCSTNSVSNALTNGISGALPTLKLSEDCGFPVNGGRLLNFNDPEVACPGERAASFAGTGSATPSLKRRTRKRTRKALSDEPVRENSSSYEGGALTFQDDSGTRSRHGAS